MTKEKTRMKSKEAASTQTQPQIHAFIEKRHSLRNPLVVLEVKWKHFDRVFLARAENVSPGGLFLSTNRSLNVGERFPLEFVLPGRKTRLTCMGEVVWTKKYGLEGSGSEGAGVRFMGMDTRKMKTIEQWIQKQESRSKKKA
jgi:uncharacterized protein (TIGR02266 family)